MDVGLVCDACSALTPIGVPQCTLCGSAVALDQAHAQTTIPATTNGANICPKCGASVAGGHRFCQSCGGRMPEVQNFEGVDTRVRSQAAAAGPPARATPAPKNPRSTLFFGGALQSSRAKLTLIRGDGQDGVSFTLAGKDHQAGRGDVPISFPDDPFLSPVHVNFIYANNQLTVRDEDSLNGVYVRITGTADLVAGSMVLIGEQVLTVSPAPVGKDEPDEEGTYFSSSMPRPAQLEVKQNLRGGETGWVYRLDRDSVTLGREGNDINFPEDPFISGRHAELRIAGSMLSVTDLGSRNGTFVRVSGERVLRHGDYVFLGQQLLRVEIV
ncbi:MAG: FHA domain-containing protein [Kofleriaceae bacterium]